MSATDAAAADVLEGIEMADLESSNGELEAPSHLPGIKTGGKFLIVKAKGKEKAVNSDTESLAPRRLLGTHINNDI